MYSALYVKTNYSILSSLITIDDYINYAKKHNITSLAITDNNMYGVMEFYKKCTSNNIKPVIGLEVELENSKILLYAKNYDGYKTLIKLSSINSYRKVEISDIEKYNNQVICVIPYVYKDIYNVLDKIIEEIYIGYSNKKEEKEILSITKNIVFLRQSLYIKENDKEYLKYLYMIRDGKTLLDDISYEINNYELEINNIYEYTSNENLFTASKIIDKCNLEFPKFENLLPEYQVNDGMTSFDYLKNLAIAGLNKRLDKKVSEVYINRLNHELDIINKMGFSNYFLVVYDFIKYAKKNNILVGPGRGSGAGSLVCYSLGITEIDPIKYNLLFERFLNIQRITLPDIDTDFPDIYRGQMIDYVKEKYGKEKVSGIVTFDTLGAKQVIRDVGRTLNIPTYQLDLITKLMQSNQVLKLKDLNNNEEFKKIISSDKKLGLLYKVALKLEGYPRHTSIHAAGVIMSKVDLDEVVPVIKNDSLYLTGYTHDYLEQFGLIKMDFLGIKTLTTIMNIIDAVNKNENKNIDFNTILLDDKNVLEVFSKGMTTGIFQFESVGMKNFLKKLKPTSLEDIFSANALYRPGPAKNIDSFIKRKNGEEKITYIESSLEEILKDTYGIITYQEQVIMIAVKLAGYTLGEADVLRSAMSKKKKEILINEKEKFIKRSVENGYSEDNIRKIYDLILDFAGYAFNRSHAVCYSIVAYKMAYLKYYYPKYFYTYLLSSDNGKQQEYIKEVKSIGIEIFKPDINKSSDNYEFDNAGIYFPLSGINGIGKINAKEIVNNRIDSYLDIFDFLGKNPKINKKMLELLIKSGSFDSFNINRKTLIENIDELVNYQELANTLDKEFVLKPDLKIEEEYSKDELIQMEKELFGFYLSNHPVTSYKARLNNIITLDKVPNYYDKVISCVVLVENIRTITTKKGDQMMFFYGSDEVLGRDFTLFPKTFNKYSNIKVGDILKVEGKIERRYDAYQIVVNGIEKLN